LLFYYFNFGVQLNLIFLFRLDLHIFFFWGGVANSTVEYSAFKCDWQFLHICMKQRLRRYYL